MAFDLSSVLREASDALDIADGREQIEYIDLSLIKADSRNFYSVDGIEELAANIELCGLQQPIRVRPDADGTFTVVSGHRRRSALCLLVEEGKTQFKSVACIVERGQASDALQELRLIYANSDTRTMSAADIAKQAERVELLLYQLKEEGVDFPGRMRDHVAEACKVSKSKLSRLKVIRDGLCSEYMADFESSKLTEQAAYALARLPEAFQRRLHELKPNIGGYAAEQIARCYSNGMRWEPKQSCPDGTQCKRGNAFLRHDMRCLDSEACGGNKCCLNCSYGNARYYACDSACSKLQKKRKEIRDKEKAAEENKRKKRTSKLFAEIQLSCARLARAGDAADLPDETLIPAVPYRKYTLGIIRKFAKGEFGNAKFYVNDFSPTEIRNYPKVCTALKCSADYLAGLTDEPTPAAYEPTLNSGSLPAVSGWYAAKFKCAEHIMRKVAWYDNCLMKFYFDDSHGRSIEAECIGWVGLPKEF